MNRVEYGTARKRRDKREITNAKDLLKESYENLQQKLPKTYIYINKILMELPYDGLTMPLLDIIG